jgi:hypothetical protein
MVSVPPPAKTHPATPGITMNVAAQRMSGTSSLSQNQAGRCNATKLENALSLMTLTRET